GGAISTSAASARSSCAPTACSRRRATRAAAGRAWWPVEPRLRRPSGRARRRGGADAARGGRERRAGGVADLRARRVALGRGRAEARAARIPVERARDQALRDVRLREGGLPQGALPACRGGRGRDLDGLPGVIGASRKPPRTGRIAARVARGQVATSGVQV